MELGQAADEWHQPLPVGMQKRLLQCGLSLDCVAQMHYTFTAGLQALHKDWVANRDRRVDFEVKRPEGAFKVMLRGLARDKGLLDVVPGN